MNGDRQRLRRMLLRAFAALSSPLRPRSVPALRTAPRILLIRPDHIGDLLFATPALRALRKTVPDAHLACMVGPWGQAVLENNPYVDEIVVCEFPAFTRKPKADLLAPYRTLRKWADQLRSSHFDLAIVLRFDHWWGALLTYLAGIPQRVGYDIPECRPFLSRAVPYVGQQHEVVQNLTLIKQAIQDSGRDVLKYPDTLEFVVTQKDREYIAGYLTERGVKEDQDVVAFHPGAGAAVKQWRTEAFAEVADAIVHRWKVNVVITGSRDELDLAWSVYARMQCEAIVAAGDTTLGQLAALFRRCSLVIGPDCGPLHLAVATGTPTVHLYGPVDARKFGPWGEPDRHLVLTSDRECIPCDRLDYSAEELPSHPCVREISSEVVLAAAGQLLGSK